ncbi:patatin-like phospholipase family protein [Oxalobacteraceae bacterium A2-2]
MQSAITIRLGPRARQRIAAEGVRPEDIAIIPAAAGGPKGLILNGLDIWLFGHWLKQAPRERKLVGASIGAWRMAAAAFDDAAEAQRRLARLYAGQRYPAKVTPDYVSRTIRALLDELLDGRASQALHSPHYRLNVLAVRGIGVLAGSNDSRWRELAGFLLAAAGNAVSRRRLAGALERVVFHDQRDDAAWLRQPFDPFQAHFAALSEDNLRDALQASGSIPLVLQAVRDIAGAPPGPHWDGGLIDYHLHLPYQRDPGLVLYPHFADHIVPGWLDKSLPWRRARDAALDNVILVAPSPEWVATLPNGKLPDRRDFHVYGQDHAGRQRDWLRAVAESERLAEAFARWCEKPDLDLAKEYSAG